MMIAENTTKNPNPEQTTKLSRWWDFIAAILLLVAMFTAGARLDATGWSKGLSAVPYVVIFGVITGLALGQSRFKALLVGLFGFFYGLYFVGWQLGSLQTGSLSWKERMLAIGGDAAEVITQISNQQSVTDSTLFIVLMSVLFWILSLWAGYALTRHGNAWWAILPAGIVLFTIHSFDSVESRRALYLAVFLFFALVLVARMTYLHQQNRWIRSRTALPPHLGMDFIRYTFVIVIVVVLVAWTAPALAKTVPAVVKASQPLRQSWEELRERWENAFTSLRSSARAYSTYYGNSVALGRGSELTDSPTLIITPPERTPVGVRYYWRAYGYDQYTNGQWLNSTHTLQDFDPTGTSLEHPELKARWENSFEILPVGYLTTLYSPSQPLWVNLSSRVSLASNLDGTVDIQGFHASTPVRPRQSYQTQSSISTATISQLREAAEIDYPDWVKERYLQLPESLTPRTRQLAEDITAGIENPYDKVVAITDYLRSNIQYQETIPAVPRGREPIDWFLFDLRKGFCNYYATAEVLLLRSVGIPARWAVGYAQGEQLDDGRYLIRQQDAHAWPEVFFPELGWIEFEPTVSQSAILRLSGEIPESATSVGLSEAELEQQRREELAALEEQYKNSISDLPAPIQPKRPSYLPWLGVILVLLLVGTVVWKNRHRFTFPSIPILIESTLVKLGIQPPQAIQHWAKRAALPPLSKSYLEINRALNRLGETIGIDLTPAERAGKLSTILPPASEPAQRLVSEYEITIYSQEAGDYNIARRSGGEIRNLSVKAFFVNLLKRSNKRALRKLSTIDDRTNRS